MEQAMSLAWYACMRMNVRPFGRLTLNARVFDYNEYYYDLR